MLLTAALVVAGVFTVVLGVAHFAFPLLLDFRRAIPADGRALKPFRLWPIRYSTRRSDVYGIAWVMNHAASYTLVTIGVLDLAASRWLNSAGGRLLALWIAGWWLLRAVSQLYLGHRTGDWMIVAGFGSLALIHLLGVLA